jgi:hypothetical protein
MPILSGEKQRNSGGFNLPLLLLLALLATPAQAQFTFGGGDTGEDAAE